jgi:pullulanase/glycogen debranching enzyme
MLLARGEEIAYPDERTLNVLLIIMNSHHEAVRFTLPDANDNRSWQRLLDTAGVESAKITHKSGATVDVTPRSLLVFGLGES